MKNLTSLGKGVLAILFLGLVVGIVFFVKSRMAKNGEFNAITEKGNVIETNSEADLVLAYNTFPGMQGILLMNEGMEPNENSELFKKYGIKLQIKQIDVVADTRDGLKNDVLDLAYCTVDALSTETGQGSALVNMGVKCIAKINESRGADALVVTRGIDKVQDLKGKKVAYAIGTASNTLLLNLLETANMSISDIESIKVADGVEAASAFKNGTCDAALVWAPDDEDCVAAIKGSKILITTATATQIIADGLLVKESTLNKKRNVISKLLEAWFEGNARLNTSDADKKKANNLFAKGFNFPVEVAALSTGKIRFSTFEDNVKFFGLDATFTGVTGEKMYSRMSVKYAETGLTKSPAGWRQVSDASIIEDLQKNSKLAHDATQQSEDPDTFKPATKEEKVAEAKGSKVVTITFATNSYDLDDFAKNVIDKEVTGIAQAFSKARIRVEGNTDNVGNSQYNKDLSFKRANAVVEYLVKEYKFDRNKFIVVGNGQNKPVKGCESNSTEDCREQNRRTDFNFIW